jgi:hypothetical protein
MSDQNDAAKFVVDETYRARLDTCHKCANFNLMYVCKTSGNVMLVPAKLKTSSCPEGKWIAKET